MVDMYKYIDKDSFRLAIGRMISARNRILNSKGCSDKTKEKAKIEKCLLGRIYGMANDVEFLVKG